MPSSTPAGSHHRNGVIGEQARLPGQEVVQARRAGLRRHDLLIPLVGGPVAERDQDLDQRVGEPEHTERPAQGTGHGGPAAGAELCQTHRASALPVAAVLTGAG